MTFAVAAQTRGPRAPIPPSSTGDAFECDHLRGRALCVQVARLSKRTSTTRDLYRGMIYPIVVYKPRYPLVAFEILDDVQPL